MSLSHDSMKTVNSLKKDRDKVKKHEKCEELKKDHRSLRREVNEIRRQNSKNDKDNIIDNLILSELVNSVKDSTKTMADSVNTTNNNTKILIDLVTKLTMIQPKEILNNVLEVKSKDKASVMDVNDDSSDEDEKRRAKNQNERRNPLTQK